MSDLSIPRKWTLRAHDQRNVFAWGMNENAEHVIMKALIWALYLPDYPAMRVEVPIGDRYKPDLIARDADGVPLFLGEAGLVSVAKIKSLVRRYRGTHFVIAKWHTRLDQLVEIVSKAQDGIERSAPFDLINFPADSRDRFIDADGHIHVTFEAVDWVRLG